MFYIYFFFFFFFFFFKKKFFFFFCKIDFYKRKFRFLMCQINQTCPLALYEAYADCMKTEYNYLLVDLTPQCSEKFRLRSSVLPHEDCVIFVPKK